MNSCLFCQQPCGDNGFCDENCKTQYDTERKDLEISYPPDEWQPEEIDSV